MATNCRESHRAFCPGSRSFCCASSPLARWFSIVKVALFVYQKRKPNDTAHQLEKEKSMKVLFVAGFGPIVSAMQESAAFYRESLGLSFQEEADGYLHTEELQGVKTFALWPLSQAAQSCFGVNEWPTDLPRPTSWLEFDVEDVAQASEELKAIGYTLLIADKKDPWGQTVTRLLSPEGILVGLTYTPAMRESDSEVQ